MFNDQRFKNFRTTLAFLVLFILVYLFSTIIQESHLFGFSNELGLRDQLSFNLLNPWRLGGLTLLTSFFMHFNLAHFLQNFIFFAWFGFLTEKALGWKKFILLILTVHMVSLLIIALATSGDHHFLGASLGALGLFVFYTIHKKKWPVLFVALVIIIGLPLSKGTDQYSTIAHSSAMIFSALFYLLGQKLAWFKQA